MEQQRRIILFATLSMAVWVLYANFVLPLWFPPLQKPRLDEAALLESLLDGPVSALAPMNVRKEVAPVDPVVADRPEHALRSVTLGSLDPASGYFVSVELTSRGGSVEGITLNDPRYPEFGKRGTPLRLVGHDRKLDEHTFDLELGDFDGVRALDRVNWEVVESSETAAVFRLVTADGHWQLEKRFSIEKTPADKPVTNAVRDTFAAGYTLKLALTAKNLTAGEMPLQYVLRGPVGLPLEDEANSYKHRDVRLGFIRGDGGVDSSQFAAKTALQKQKDKKPEVWQRPIGYIGIDTQYFAALVHPVQDQTKESQQTIVEAYADILKEGRYPQHSDISLRLLSATRKLPAGGELTDEYELFAGPKREALLAEFQAEPVLDYGWFAVLVRLMLWVFNSLHGMGLSYGMAIIGLTVIIRTGLVPMSLHQSRTMDKMKEHQPKMKVLHEKMKKDPESLTPDERRQLQEIQLKMMGGCLPLFLQMPIFIALYRSLQVSVDLRMAPMHIYGTWIDNLASPDRLFPFGFEVPWMEWNEFNLLPIFSIVLMIVNQKLTMPPALDDEQKAQQTAMSFSMGIIGFLFYRMPSGLCLYIITSSIWGTVERLILKKKTPDATGTAAVATAAVSTSAPPVSSKTEPAPPAAPGFFDGFKQKVRDLQEMADKQTQAKRLPTNDSSKNNKKKGKR